MNIPKARHHINTKLYLLPHHGYQVTYSQPEYSISVMCPFPKACSVHLLLIGDINFNDPLKILSGFSHSIDTILPSHNLSETSRKAL